MAERLQKFLAKSGIGSRRYCEELIKSGKVRHVGISNETPWGTNEYLKYSNDERARNNYLFTANYFNDNYNENGFKYSIINLLFLFF